MKNKINVKSFENCKTFEYNIASNKPNFHKISKLVTYSDAGSSPVCCVKKVSEKIIQRYVCFSLQKGHLYVIPLRNDRLIDSGLNVGYERHILTLGDIQ